MCEFDTYINTIIGGLRLSKNKKEELAEEFKDHLESLKSEFIKNGFSESESIKRAIERFGDSSDIKKKLYISFFSLRKSGNVIFGAVLTFILIIFSYIPMTGVTMAFNGYNSTFDISTLLFANKWYIFNCILFFIPIGYFLPIILNREGKILQLALTFSTLGILAGVFLNIVLTNSVNVVFLLECLASGLLGGMAGYMLLIAINKVRKNERVTRSF